MWWKYLIGLLMTGMIIAVFTLPPPQTVIGDASRIFFFHVPAALLGFLSFAAAAIFGVIYLKNRQPSADRRAAVAAEIGLTATVIATISGAIFAKVTWGAYWNWDPRQTTILGVLLIYAAYFALRQAVADRQARARLSAVYILVGGAIAPFLFFVLPRLYSSLHPKDSLVSGQGQFVLTLPVALTFAASLIAFTLLGLWLFQLADRAERIKEELEIKGDYTRLPRTIPYWP